MRIVLWILVAGLFVSSTARQASLRAEPATPRRAPAAGTAARPQDRSVASGVFTEAQARRGADVYLRECSVCHGDTLDGGEGSPALTGSEFNAKWYGKTVGDLFEAIRSSMPPPPDQPGRLTAQQYADVLAYVLSVHKFPFGTTELATDAERLQRIRLEAMKR